MPTFGGGTAFASHLGQIKSFGSSLTQMSETALRFDLEADRRPAGPGAGVRSATTRHDREAHDRETEGSRLDARCFGVSLRLDSEDPDFTAFAARNYRAFLGAPAGRPDISVRFGPRAGAAARARKAAMSRLGMGLLVDSESLYWENAFGFSVLVTPRGEGGFEVLAYHFDLERERDPDLRARNHQRSLRWALHFPLFHCLGARKGLSLLHASALGFDDGAGCDRALVFCGMNGVGKSSLAAFLAGQPGYRFMTDNFLLAARERLPARRAGRLLPGRQRRGPVARAAGRRFGPPGRRRPARLPGRVPRALLPRGPAAAARRRPLSRRSS